MINKIKNYSLFKFKIKKIIIINRKKNWKLNNQKNLKTINYKKKKRILLNLLLKK